MTKKILFTSFVTLLLLCICFCGIYSFMLYYCKDTDSINIDGHWTCVQYFADGKSMMGSNEELIIADNNIDFAGNDILTEFSADLENLYADTYSTEIDGKKHTIMFEINSRNQLKLLVKELEITLVFNKN